MTLLLGAVGWSMFAFGAAFHIWHYGRFEDLISLHFRRARALSRGLVLAEALLAVVIPIAFGFGLSNLLLAASLLAALLGAGFTIWVGRLLATRSPLPCACSYSPQPASMWSLLRSAGTLLVLAFPLADYAGSTENLATIAVGAAIGLALFVLPDTLAWPAAARQMREELAT